MKYTKEQIIQICKDFESVEKHANTKQEHAILFLLYRYASDAMLDIQVKYNKETDYMDIANYIINQIENV